MPLKFTVCNLFTNASGKHILKLSHQDYPNNFFSFFGSVKLEKAVPPNQLFVHNGLQTLARGAAASSNINDDLNDDEDPEPVVDNADNVAEGKQGTADEPPPAN